MRAVRYVVLGTWYVGMLALAPSTVLAQEPLATDRPDFVESSLTVGRGVLQIETSVATDWVDIAGTTARVVGTPTLFRLGVSRAVELRLESEGYQRATFGDADATTGLADASIGLKWHARDGDAGRPSMAFLVHADLASGSEEFQGDGVRPSLRAVAEWELSGTTSLGIMPGIGAVGNDEWAGQFGIVLGRSFSETVRGFLEYAAEEIPFETDGEVVSYLQFGTAWVVTPDFQIDLSGGLGLTDAASDGAIAIGFSRRWR